MKYLAIFSAAILVACTVTPAVIKTEESELPTPPPTETLESKGQRESVSGKTGVKPKSSNLLPCANINTGDLKEDIKAKLDCLSRYK